MVLRERPARAETAARGTQLAIVGADPPPAMRKLGEMPGVTVTGSVPDVRPYLHEAAVMVAPLRIARGTQNKILEGMAAGVPVVASQVAAGGVDAVTPDHLPDRVHGGRIRGGDPVRAGGPL